MLPVAWLVVAVVVAILLTMWVTFTLTRLDRLHARVDAAQASMDAQLVRRAAALQHIAESPSAALSAEVQQRYLDAAQRAITAGMAAEAVRDPDREAIENAVGRSVSELASTQTLPSVSAAELDDVAARVRIARRFYNDAVRDTRTLRARRMPRLFHLAGRRAMPEFFDIDDSLSVGVVTPAPPDQPAPSRDRVPRGDDPPATADLPGPAAGTESATEEERR